jgi:hypothetical protein
MHQDQPFGMPFGPLTRYLERSHAIIGWGYGVAFSEGYGTFRGISPKKAKAQRGKNGLYFYRFMRILSSWTLYYRFPPKCPHFYPFNPLCSTPPYMYAFHAIATHINHHFILCSILRFAIATTSLRYMYPHRPPKAPPCGLRPPAEAYPRTQIWG